MSTERELTSDFIEQHREMVEHPLLQLFQDYGRGNRRWFIIGVLTSTAARFLSLVPPVILGTAVDSLFHNNTPFTLPFIPQAWLPTTTWTQFWFAVGVMAVAMVGSAFLNFARQSSLNLFSHRVKHEVRTATYQQMQRLDMAFFNEMQTGELMSILSNDTNRLEQFLDSMMGEAIQLGVLLLGTGAILFWINPQLALVTMAIVPVAALFTYWFMRMAEERYTDVRASVGDLNSRLENNLNGIQVIKASNTEPYEDERVRDHSYQYFRLDWLALRLNFIYRPGLQALTSISFILTFIVGGVWLIQGRAPGPLTGGLTTGNLVTFLLLAQRLVNPLAQMGTIVDRYEDAKASTKRILGLMSLPVSIQNAPDAIDLEDGEGRVEYDSVSFAYEDEAILSDIDFTVEPGETVGVVGPTGAGKTTILKLLLRLYDADTGAVRIDGYDVRAVTVESLRQSVGYVGQENFLFLGFVSL